MENIVDYLNQEIASKAATIKTLREMNERIMDDLRSKNELNAELLEALKIANLHIDLLYHKDLRLRNNELITKAEQQ